MYSTSHDKHERRAYIMKKALIVASVASMIDQFNIPNIKLLRELGYEVHVACNFLEGNTCSDERIAALKKKLTDMSVGFYQLPFSRSVSALGAHLGAYKALKKMLDEGGYDIVHCHSPIGSIICRLAARSARKKQGTVVIYTAHGFHFYDGAPKMNWLVFYPVEKFCSRMTDMIITINQEDYRLARDKMKAGRVVLVSGVGIDAERFAHSSVERGEMRRSLNIPEDAFLVVSVGELNENKNHQVVIRAMASLGDPRIHYCIAGRGHLEGQLVSLADELGVADRVHLLGFRADIPDIYGAADACAFPSIREGLGLAAIEGMAAGLPLIASDNRGTRDYAVHMDNALVCKHDDVDAFAKALRILSDEPALAESMGEKNRLCARRYDVSKVNEIMREIYSNGK